MCTIACTLLRCPLCAVYNDMYIGCGSSWVQLHFTYIKETTCAIEGVSSLVSPLKLNKFLSVSI